MLQRASKKNGFTLIEILIVAAILSLLTTIGLVSFQSANQKSRNGKRESDISQVRSALELYRATESSYPIHSSYASLMGDADFLDYIATPEISDPRNVSPYVYTYSSNGLTYTTCYTTEPDQTQVCLNNP